MVSKISFKEFQFLEKHLNALRAEGLDDETIDRIKGMVEYPHPDPNRSSRRIRFALAGLAIAMFGMALLLQICHHWQFIPASAKIAIILLPWLITFAAGARFRQKTAASELLLFASGILYGLGIWQIAQIFHYPADFSEGGFYWGLGLWLSAFTARTPLLPIFASVTLCCWETAVFCHDQAIPFLLPPMALAGWYFFRRRNSPLSAFIYKYLLFSWGFLFPGTYNDDSFFLVWTVWSALFFFFRLFVTKKQPLSIELFLLGIGLLGLSVYETNDRLFDRESLAVSLTIAANIAVFILTFFLLRRRGKNAGKTFYLAIIYFMIWAVIQYINLFGDFGGYLGASLIFGLTGLILILAAVIHARTVKKQPAVTADPKPVKYSAVSNRSCTHKSYAVLFLTLSFLVQTAVFGKMIVFQTLAFRSAEHITVETRPADPRDLFCGDYVRLNYAFSNPISDFVQNEEGEWIESQPSFDTEELPMQSKKRIVYTILQKEEDGIWRPIKITPARPAEGIFLRGKYDRWQIKYGIETWYVKEGEGKTLEEAIQNSVPNIQGEPAPPAEQVLVDLAVNKRGRAKIENVRSSTTKERITFPKRVE